MKIQSNDCIYKYFKECEKNIANNIEVREYIDDNIDEKIKKIDREVMLLKLQSYGIPVDTLLFDSNELLQNPYYKNIKLANIKEGEFKYINRVIPKETLINMTWLIHGDKTFKEYGIPGYFDIDVNVPVLKQGNNVWMSPTIAEQRSMQYCIDKATGNVLTFGLGLGYFPYMCLLKDEVKTITIVEINEEVINIFKKYILPQFDTNKKIEIIHGDLFQLYNEEFLNKFDYTFVDVWKDNDEGLDICEKLFEQYNYKGNIDYWVEYTMMRPIRLLILLYFKELAEGSIMEFINMVDGDNLRYVKKIHKYFRNIDKTLTTAEELQEYIYDERVVRQILGTKY